MSKFIAISGLANSGKDTTANFFVEEFGFVSISFADPMKRICMDLFDWDENRLWGPSEERNKPDKRYLRSYSYRLDARCLAILDSVADDNRELTEEESFERWHKEVKHEYLNARYALQKLGSNWGRDCYKDLWVEYAIRTARKLLAAPGALTYTKTEGLHHPKVGAPIVQGVIIPDNRYRNEIDLMKEAGAVLIRIKRSGAGLSGALAQHSSEAEQGSIPDAEFDYILENNGTLDELKAKVLKIGNELGLLKVEDRQLKLFL